MRITSAVITTLALSALPWSVRAQSEINTSDSISRIRAALEPQPSALQPPPAASPNDVPTFRSETHEQFWTQPASEQKPIDTTYGLPTVTGLMMDGLGKIQSAKHRRTERRAQKEVATAIAEFCATNVCSTLKGAQQ